MINFYHLFIVIFIFNIFLINGKVSSKRLCANLDCTEIISYGQTKLTYRGPTNDPKILAFPKGKKVKIYSKPAAGSDSDLWGVDVDDVGKGYAPLHTILENSVIRDDLIEVDTENVPSHTKDKEEINVTPEPTKPYQVFEGTTLYDSSITVESSTPESSNVNDLSLNEETQPLHSNHKVETDTPVSSDITSKNETDLPAVNATETIIVPINEVVPKEINGDNVKQTNNNPQETSADKDDHELKVGDEETKTLDQAPVAEVIQREQSEEIDTLQQDKVKILDNSNTKNSTDVNQMDANEGGSESDDDDDDLDEEDEDDGIIEDDVEDEQHQGEVQEPMPTDQEQAPEKAPTSEEMVTSSLKEEGKELDNDTNIINIAQIEEPSTLNVQSQLPMEELKESNESMNNLVEESREYMQSSVQVDTHKVETVPNDSVPIISSPLLNDTVKLENSEEQEASKVGILEEPSNTGGEQLFSQNEAAKENANAGIPVEFENEKVKDDAEDAYFEKHQNVFDYSNAVVEQVVNHEETKEGIKESELENKEMETPKIETHKHDFNTLLSQHVDDEFSCSADPLSDCKIQPQAIYDTNNIFKFPNSAILTVLVIAAVTVVTFLWGYMYMEKRGRESNLIGKINNIQKDYLIVKKENEILKDKLDDVESEFNEKANAISNETVLELQEQLELGKNTQSILESQIQSLEKELENSTEVGLELNRMLSEFLNSENGSETLVANIDQLQRQIIEQQAIINTYNENLNMKETENHELRLEVEINNTKVTELQSELNKMALSLLKLEEDKEQSQGTYEAELEKIKAEFEMNKNSFTKEKNKFMELTQGLKDNYEQVQKAFELKSNEYLLLKENFKKVENNADVIKSLVEVSAINAELLQLRKEKQVLTEQLRDERNKSRDFEVMCQNSLQDLQNFKEKYDEADREKVEALTKLQVLDKYFKEREAHLQKELNKQESMWVEKQGEATSTIERIKYMQEELQNYKTQNESLKQEILEQEVQMKSQISVLEKKAHENWVAARQAERKVEEAKQESAQLRNRLTLRERSFTEEKMHNRVQSPLEQNGELPVSPAHASNDTAASPPLLFGTRENMTISPPIPGLPFLPPPPGVPFMPPPLGGVPLPPPGFMPPPPSLMPGDHRPPPLGRISSPPLNSRYSPDRAYSPYSRNSPSPISDDDYDRMLQPPMYREYNSYSRDRRRDIPLPVRVNPRNNKGGGHSSGSANSNDSLDKINRHNSKV